MCLSWKLAQGQTEPRRNRADSQGSVLPQWAVSINCLVDYGASQSGGDSRSHGHGDSDGRGPVRPRQGGAPGIQSLGLTPSPPSRGQEGPHWPLGGR